MAKIGVDLDGVVYDWPQAVYNELVIYWGLTADFYSFWNKEHKTYKNKMFWDNLVRIEHLYSNQLPDREDLNFLYELSKDNDLYYITNRPKEASIVTTNWLKRYEFPQNNNLYFCDNKAIVANSLGITKFFEDRAENVVKLLDAGVEVFIVNQPYNMDYHFDCKRVNKISELKGLL